MDDVAMVYVASLAAIVWLAIFVPATVSSKRLARRHAETLQRIVAPSSPPVEEGQAPFDLARLTPADADRFKVIAEAVAMVVGRQIHVQRGKKASSTSSASDVRRKAAERSKN